MTNTSSRFVAAALATSLAVAGASTAQANDNWVGPAAIGVVGGLLLGGAIANSRPAYAYPPPPAYGYVPPAYAAPTYSPTYVAPPVGYAPQTVYTTPAYTTQAPTVTYVTRSPHTDWCYANRPAYNPADNSFQPVYGGAREYCQSPFGY